MTVEVGAGEWRYRLVHDWEQMPEGMEHPDVPSVAVSSDDKVYLFTRSDPSVFVYDLEGRFLSAWEAQFLRAHHLSIAPDGSVFCVDKDRQVVEKFSPTGELLLRIGEANKASNTGYEAPDYLTVHTSGGPFNGPATVAVGIDDRIYVADGYGNARLHCFSASGDLLFSVGRPGEGPGEFRLPHSVAVSPDGTIVYVADRENSRVQLFDQDGAHLGIWDDFARPLDLHVDQTGHIYVTEIGYYIARYPSTKPDWDDGPPTRVTILEPSGRVVCRWGTRDQHAPGSFFSPHGIATDSAGSIYISEVGWESGRAFGLEPPDRPNVQKYVRL